jgi:hypothetical protein
MSEGKEKFYIDPERKRLIKDDGVWFFVYNGEWLRSRYYEGILMGDCWCDLITRERAEELMQEYHS